MRHLQCGEHVPLIRQWHRAERFREVCTDLEPLTVLQEAAARGALSVRHASTWAGRIRPDSPRSLRRHEVVEAMG